MNRSLAPILVTVLSLAAGQIAVAQKGDRPPIPAAQHINGKPVYDQNVTPVVESSLPLMWETADAVVDVQVNTGEVKGIGDRPVHVRTFFTSKVLRVYKGSLQKGSTVVFTQGGVLSGRPESGWSRSTACR